MKLTPAGRLPRAFVRQVQDVRPEWGFWPDRPAHVEEDLIPLHVLHEGLRRVGLLRLRNGHLAPTRAAGDPVQTLRRLRGWFGPAHGFTHLLATAAIGLLAATARCCLTIWARGCSRLSGTGGSPPTGTG